MSFPCPSCGEALVNTRRTDVVYEMTGKFSTWAYLFPRVFCPKCRRELAKVETGPPSEDSVGRRFWDQIRDAFG